EEEEEEGEANETMMMNRAFNEKRKSNPMEQSVIDLSLDEGNEEEKKAATVSELPDFIPLIDGEEKKKKRGKGKQQQSPFVQPLQPVGTVGQQKNGGTQQQQNGGSSSFPSFSSPLVMTRTKSTRERKREMYRKRAETRAMELGASPASIAKAVAASTCSFPLSVTPSKIPLPFDPAPPTPWSHLYRFPPSSSSSSSFPPSSSSSFPSSSSAMGLIQSRGISTSSSHSQPIDFGGIGISHSSSLGGNASSPPTLAAVLQDEASGIVRDSLTASGIYRRQWEEKWMSTSDQLSRPDLKVDPSASPFRICSYNVLCQKTISSTSYLYRHLKFKQDVLEWSHRWPLIQRELSELNADVFGLQEIQDVHFEEYYEPYMKSLGYNCYFQRKSQTTHSDGLGVFVRANRFKITSMNTVDFLVPGDNLMDRGNVAQVFRVECLQTGASLIITNTHILFNEKRGDIKLGQIALLMANIHAMRREDEPVICLGDWNLEPASDLYIYITGGSLDASQFVPRYGSGQLREGRNIMSTPMRELPMDTHLKTRMARDGILYQTEGALLQSLQRSHPSTFSHQIPLTSTYAPYRERQVSTYHKDTANPDFIFYTTAGRGETESHRLRLIRRLSIPPEENIRSSMEPWPNHAVPSDHIPLLAEFYLSK
ncbi:hypothetical protein PENTCL1PPCAC_2092, partial [Pristionchus entomophagus]